MVIVLPVTLEVSLWIITALLVERTPSQKVETKANAISVLNVQHVTQLMETARLVLLESSWLRILAILVKPIRNQKEENRRSARSVSSVQPVTLPLGIASLAHQDRSLRIITALIALELKSFLSEDLKTLVLPVPAVLSAIRLQESVHNVQQERSSRVEGAFPVEPTNSQLEESKRTALFVLAA